MYTSMFYSEDLLTFNFLLRLKQNKKQLCHNMVFFLFNHCFFFSGFYVFIILWRIHIVCVYLSTLCKCFPHSSFRFYVFCLFNLTCINRELNNHSFTLRFSTKDNYANLYHCEYSFFYLFVCIIRKKKHTHSHSHIMLGFRFFFLLFVMCDDCYDFFSFFSFLVTIR